jgi:hypothetical protein
LKSKGAEVVKFDITIKEDIKNALSGADIAWLVTNYWDKVSNKNMLVIYMVYILFFCIM